jgi:hypothetical protein
MPPRAGTGWSRDAPLRSTSQARRGTPVNQPAPPGPCTLLRTPRRRTAHGAREESIRLRQALAGSCGRRAGARRAAHGARRRASGSARPLHPLADAAQERRVRSESRTWRVSHGPGVHRGSGPRWHPPAPAAPCAHAFTWLTWFQRIGRSAAERRFGCKGPSEPLPLTSPSVTAGRMALAAAALRDARIDRSSEAARSCAGHGRAGSQWKT